jgi:hypothetical protein
MPLRGGLFIPRVGAPSQRTILVILFFDSELHPGRNAELACLIFRRA